MGVAMGNYKPTGFAQAALFQHGKFQRELMIGMHVTPDQHVDSIEAYLALLDEEGMPTTRITKGAIDALKKGEYSGNTDDFMVTFITPYDAHIRGFVDRTNFPEKCVNDFRVHLLTPEEFLQICTFQPYANAGMQVFVPLRNGVIITASNDWQTQHISVLGSAVLQLGPKAQFMFKM